MSILDVFALLGGVGLFLYGMMQMSSGLKNAAGDNLRIGNRRNGDRVRQLRTDEFVSSTRGHHGSQYRHHRHRSADSL